MWRKGRAKSVVRVAAIPNPVPQLFCPDIDLAGDISSILRELIASLGKMRFGSRAQKLCQKLSTARSQLTSHAPREWITVEGTIAAINNTRTKGAIIVSDIGLFRHYAAILAEVDAPNGFITSAGGSSFGFGLPAAIGAALAQPEKEIIVICGDGGFHSSSHDLETIARLGLKITIIVLNNGSNGLINLYQNIGHGKSNSLATDFSPVDFAALARANGCLGVHCKTPVALVEAIQTARLSPGPTVIDAPFSYHSAASTADFSALRI